MSVLVLQHCMDVGFRAQLCVCVQCWPRRPSVQATEATLLHTGVVVDVVGALGTGGAADDDFVFQNAWSHSAI
eukprot:130334-Prymnesium_polylepis.1